MTGREGSVIYKEIKPDEYLVTTYISASPVEFRERFHPGTYPLKSGDVQLERCGKCGLPVELSQYSWVADRGVIEHKLTGRRMVIFVSLTFEAVFEELEKELGEPIAEVIIGAQKDFMKTGFFSIDQVNNEDNMRAQFALRGMGNLKEMRFGEDGLDLRVENPAVPLLTVGFSQGLFELAFGIDSEVAWNQSQDGDLDIVVTPR